MKPEITVDYKSRKVLAAIGEAPRRHKKALRLALNEIGSEIVNLMANYIFRPPKTGRWYTYRGQRYQASAPGESPANRSGKLAGSGGYRVASYSEMRIYETAEYAGYLEFGTKGGKIKPRPHVIRAINANRRNAVRSILDHVKKEIKL